jgi:hypothetical protein
MLLAAIWRRITASVIWFVAYADARDSRDDRGPSCLL